MRHMTNYQLFSNCLLINVSDGTQMWINFNHNSGKVYYRNKIGSPTNIKHTGVFLGTDAYGTEWWVHNHYHVGTAHVVTGEEFKKGMPIYLYNVACTNPRNTVIDKAMQHVQRGERYKPLTYNCQTLVNDVCRNERKSEDADRLLGGALLGVGLAVLFGAIAASNE